MTTTPPAGSPATPPAGNIGQDARNIVEQTKTLAADAAPALADAAQLITDAQSAVTASGHTSRELSLVLTKLDEAVMWLHNHLTHTER